jgi:subtilisin-like proprotein convertase family protein
MAATTYNFSIEQGTSFSIQFKYLKAEDAEPINLSNHCVTLRILPTPDDETFSLPVITYTTVSQTVTPFYSFSINPEEGIISLKLSAEMTNLFLQPGASEPVPWSVAKYELEILRPDNFFQGSMKTINRLLQGEITLDRRLIPAVSIPGCGASSSPNTSVITEEQVSFSALDSCIGSPCEFIGGNANIYTLTNPEPSFYGDTSLILKDLDFLENPNGNSYPKYLSLNVPESKIIDRIDVMIENMSHNFAQDVRLLLTHSGSGVLLISNNKFNFDNKPRNLSYILSDYTPLRTDPTDPEPTVGNVNHYFSSLLTNKNLGAARPRPVTKDIFPEQAFDEGDITKNITQYGYTLSTFENMNAEGEWRIYGLDTERKNSGSIGAVKLIIYFKNEQSNDLSNSLYCGGVTRSGEISGTEITISGDKTSEFIINNLVVIKYNTGFGEAFTIRTIISSPYYDTENDITTFSINNAIDGISGTSIDIDRYHPESAV